MVEPGIDEGNVPTDESREDRPVVVIVGAGSKHGRLRTTTDDDDDKNDDKNETTAGIDRIRWGLGGALSVLFATKGYDVVLMGRRKEVLDDVRAMVEEEVRRSGSDRTLPPQEVVGVACDVTDDGAVRAAFAKTRDSIASFGGYIDLVIFNVAPPYPPNFRVEGWGDILLPHQIDLDNMAMQENTQVHGLVRVSREVLPDMIDRKRGCVLVTGESCTNLSGKHEFGSVAPTRAALRVLAQSMFRAYGPMGIHVCTINIGGILDSPKTRTWSSLPDSIRVNPHDVAEEFWRAYQQRPTVWSHEIQLTPSLAANDVDTRL